MNQIGQQFRLSIFGESHGPKVGVSIDGIPPGIALDVDDFSNDLQRRRTGGTGTSTRLESDQPEIISGHFNGFTTGAPLTIIFTNESQKSTDYSFVKNSPRPGHADFVADRKYRGFEDYRGGGHFSGRLTLCLVASGVIAKKILSSCHFSAKVIEIGGNTDTEEGLQKAILKQDTVGGLISCEITGVPIGLGEPFFDSLESKIAHLAFAVPAVKGIEFGSGFSASRMYGSEHNDALLDKDGFTATNNSGGINGGISNGNPITFRVAIKPASSTPKEQFSFNKQLNAPAQITVTGRHDLCIALRAPVVMEAIAAIAIADAFLCNNSFHV